jgi:phenylacetate-CoA ligase
MTLLCEVSGETNGPGVVGLPEGLAASLRDTTKLRAEVRLVPPGSLPNDGKVIEDTRKLD